jgi:Ni/Co efflux regulator RcnB
MNKLVSVILCTAVVFAPLAAQAGQLNNRLNRQDARIYQGVKNGSLTPKEYHRLDKLEDKNEAARLRAIKSGGKLTYSERHRLNHRLNNTSKAIYRAKHN